MTIRQYCEKYCTDRGMWPSQATTVVKALEADKTVESMKGRLEDDASGYPAPLLSILVHRLRHVVLDFIDRECPLVFFRSLFVDDPVKPTEPQ